MSGRGLKAAVVTTMLVVAGTAGAARPHAAAPSHLAAPPPVPCSTPQNGVGNETSVGLGNGYGNTGTGSGLGDGQGNNLVIASGDGSCTGGGRSTTRRTVRNPRLTVSISHSRRALTIGVRLATHATGLTRIEVLRRHQHLTVRGRFPRYTVGVPRPGAWRVTVRFIGTHHWANQRVHRIVTVT